MPPGIKMLFQIAIRDAPLPAGTRLVAFVLATYMGRDGCAWPSVGTLAAGAGLSDRQTQRALRELQAAGVLEIVPRPGRPSTYLATGAGGDTQMSPQTSVRGDTQMSGGGDTQMSGGGDTQMSPEVVLKDSRRGLRARERGRAREVDADANGDAPLSPAELAREAAAAARRLLDADRGGSQ